MWESFLWIFVGFFNTLFHIIISAGLTNDSEVTQGKKKDMILLFCNIERTLFWNCNIMPTVVEHTHDVPEDSI